VLGRSTRFFGKKEMLIKHERLSVHSQKPF